VHSNGFVHELPEVKFCQHLHVGNSTDHVRLQMAEQVAEFLRRFYDIFPEYKYMDVSRLLHQFGLARA
jgi:hypothetical protein